MTGNTQSNGRFVVALDSGTSSCRALAVNESGAIVVVAQQEFTQFYPQPGWVEQNASEIWQVQEKVLREVVAQIGGAGKVAAVGITNQRETTVVWDRETGEPLHPAIVWQCRRSTAICERLRQGGHEAMVREKTGLLLDPYFSGTKLTWLFENRPDLQTRAEAGAICFGTVDSWLLWKLSGDNGAGEARHLIDRTNASRTLLYNLHTGEWDDELLALFGVPRAMLPAIVPSSQRYFEADIDGVRVSVASAIGDQQAALFGQRCFAPGMAKNTYGTGCFLLLNTGDTPPSPTDGLLATVACDIDGKITYALEGSVFVAGAAVQWLRDSLGIITRADETEAIAQSVPNNNGVYFVPAFTGLGTPYWEPDARGMIVGLTRGANRAHLVRATLESIAYQTRDVIEAMARAAGLSLPVLRVDGGATGNDFLLQFQADILGIPVARGNVQETTALGAALLAGLAVGYWDSVEEIAHMETGERIFTPVLPETKRESLYQGWQKAVNYQVNTLVGWGHHPLRW